MIIAIEFDKTWHQRCYGNTPMPEDLCLATEYHSRAAMTMTIWWILSDMPVSPDFITDMITKMRDAGVFRYGFRVYPNNPELPHRQDFAFTRWI